MTGPGNIPAPSPGSLTLSPIFSTLNERAEFVSIATFSEKTFDILDERRGEERRGREWLFLGIVLVSPHPSYGVIFLTKG